MNTFGQKYFQIKIFFCIILTAFLFLGSTSAMNQQTPPASWMKSPKKVITPIRNYCKEIIETCAEDDITDETKINEVREIFQSYMDQLPYTARVDNQDYFSSLCNVIAMCLFMGTDMSGTFYKAKKSCDIYAIALQDPNDTDKAYVLQIRRVNGKTEKDRQQKIFYVADNDEKKKVVLIGLDIFFNENAPEQTNPISFFVQQINNKKEGRSINAAIRSTNATYKQDHLFKRRFFGSIVNKKNDNLSKFLTTFYECIDSSIHIKLEKYYQGLLFSAIVFMGFVMENIEICTAVGRIDILFETRDYYAIIEFKLNGNVPKAMNQIKKCNYASLLKNEDKTVYAVGINVTNFPYVYKKNFDVQVNIEDYAPKKRERYSTIMGSPKKKKKYKKVKLSKENAQNLLFK